MENGGHATHRPNRGEVVRFEILTERRLDELAAVDGPIPVVGELVPGAVMVTNQWGASWCMSPEDFDEIYKALEV